MRKILASTAAGLALMGGSVAVAATSLAGTAGAQTNAPSASSDPTTSTPHRAQHPRRAVAVRAIREVAQVLNMTPKDLLTELRTGKSIAQVAQDKGVPAQTVIDDLVAKVNERVDQAVTNGKLTADQAAKIKEKAPERITTLVNRQFPAKPASQP